MLLETGLFGTLIAAGAAADRLSTARTKLRLFKFLSTTEHRNWREFIANAAYSAYVRVFGERSLSRRFIFRSTIAYFLLTVGSFVFLWIFFPTTAEAIFSVFKYGQSFEVFSWVLCMLIGCPMYVIANAQTLFFLEILKSSPNMFRFFLAAYADFLITASVALFGIAALMWFHAYNTIYLTHDTVPINVTFSRSARLPVNEDWDLLRARLPARELASLRQERRGIVVVNVTLDYRRSLDFYMQEVADYQTMRLAVQSGQVEGQVSRDGSFSFARRSVVVPGVEQDVPLAPPVEGRILIGVDSRALRNNFCRASEMASWGGRSFAAVSLTREDRNRLADACDQNRAVVIYPAVSYNTSNIRFDELYIGYVMTNLNEMVSSVRTGFRSYMAISPHSFINFPDTAVWSPNVRFARFTEDDPVGINRGIMYFLSVHNGAEFSFVVRSIPAGTLNFTIMSTSIFLALIMSLAALSFPIVVTLVRISKPGAIVDIRKYPFSISSTVVALWGVVLWLIISL